MNYLAWSSGLASAAQNCANKCPQYDDACGRVYMNHIIKLSYGVVFYHKPLTARGDFDAQDILRKMMEKDKYAR